MSEKTDIPRTEEALNSAKSIGEMLAKVARVAADLERELSAMRERAERAEAELAAMKAERDRAVAEAASWAGIGGGRDKPRMTACEHSYCCPHSGCLHYGEHGEEPACEATCLITGKPCVPVDGAGKQEERG